MAIPFSGNVAAGGGVIGNYSAQGKPLGGAATGPNASCNLQKSKQNQRKALINHSRRMDGLWTAARRRKPGTCAPCGGVAKKKRGGHKARPDDRSRTRDLDVENGHDLEGLRVDHDDPVADQNVVVAA